MKIGETLQAQYANVLADNLVGMNVHGSIAMNCYNPESSDIDILVVVKEKLSLEIKKKLGQIHKAFKKIELSVVTQDSLSHFKYPTPFEFHYSDSCNNSFDGGTDYDLAAHFVIAKKYGITLVGQPASEIFPEIPVKDYLDSISRDSKESFNNIMSGPDKGKCSIPKYAVLNFCRVLAFIKDGLITSKKSGAEWALTHLPNEYAVLIQEALNEYQKSGSSQEISCKSLKEFALYANRVIDSGLTSL